MLFVLVQPRWSQQASPCRVALQRITKKRVLFTTYKSPFLVFYLCLLLMCLYHFPEVVLEMWGKLKAWTVIKWARKGERERDQRGRWGRGEEERGEPNCKQENVTSGVFQNIAMYGSFALWLKYIYRHWEKGSGPSTAGIVADQGITSSWRYCYVGGTKSWFTWPT